MKVSKSFSVCSDGLFYFELRNDIVDPKYLWFVQENNPFSITTTGQRVGGLRVVEVESDTNVEKFLIEFTVLERHWNLL